MKLPIMLLVIVAALGIVGLPAYAAPHDFAHYKQETLKLFSTLKLDPADVSFIEVTQAPSIEYRQQHRSTLFVNPTALNAKPYSVALFSCAVEAKLATLSPDEWEK